MAKLLVRAFLAFGLILCVPGAHAGVIYTLVVADRQATSPAINDNGEVVYVQGGLINASLISTVRGTLVTGVAADSVGISNSGEVVWADDSIDSRIWSSVRGVLTTTRSYGPTIAATTGEVAYVGNAPSGGPEPGNVFTTLQGQVEFFDPLLYFPTGIGDVNDFGEVVFQLRMRDTGSVRIYSTTRGYLTPDGINALSPAINNSGEVVYYALDSGDHFQIFSTTRGQLTFFDGESFSFREAAFADIDNLGNVVFRGNLSDDPYDARAGLYLITPCSEFPGGGNTGGCFPGPGPFPAPEPGTLALLGLGLAGLTFARRRKH